MDSLKHGRPAYWVVSVDELGTEAKSKHMVDAVGAVAKVDELGTGGKLKPEVGGVGAMAMVDELGMVAKSKCVGGRVGAVVMVDDVGADVILNLVHQCVDDSLRLMLVGMDELSII